ncbi:MAG TPA: DUF47 family protein [Clostridiaceae bacterium]
MFSLSPKEDKFYDYFIETADIIYETSNMLTAFMHDYKDPEEKQRIFKELEHKGDQQMHKILKALNLSFITPLDREDIYAIARVMDDIIDFIETAACRFAMFHVTSVTEEAKQISILIDECCKSVIELMKELRVAKKFNKLKETIININRIEEEGDLLYRKAITKLFSEDIPVIEIIKWREIYEHLENTLDACEDVADIVEGIVMKHA